jgi:hypothetical protein
MRIKRGWSTDFGKNRFDAEAEETDLLRVLAEAGFDDPAKIAAEMKASDVYRVLDAEVMGYVHDTLRKHEKPKAEEHLAKIREYRAERDRILAKYRPASDVEAVAG